MLGEHAVKSFFVMTLRYSEVFPKAIQRAYVLDVGSLRWMKTPVRF